MRVVTLIPFFGKPDDRRTQLWDWTRPFLEELGWDIYVGDDGRNSRAGSVNDAAAKAGDWDVAFIGDSDTIQEPAAAHYSAEWCFETGKAAQPWNTRHKLSQVGTLQCVQRGPEEYHRGWLDRADRTSPKGGGASVMVSRAAWDKVGGMDARFVGYGNEDLAFQYALETLAIEEFPRHEGVVWHLWHKPARHVGTARAATPANQQRLKLYQAARGNVDAMREVLA